MKFKTSIPIRALADQYKLTIIGDDEIVLTGINEIHKVEQGDITFADNEKYFKPALQSVASAVILPNATPAPEGKALLITDQPFKVYNQIALDHHPFRALTAAIGENTEIHPSAIIEPNVVIGHNVKIGAHSYIQANVVIHGNTIIGEHTNIHSGAIIGTDAFYYNRDNRKFLKWHSCGRVVIGDHVEIGACCTINSGVSGDTVIGDGTKFDSQVHIGHGAVIGKNCLFAAQVGIGGKTIIGNNVILYGQVGISQNLVIGDGVTVLAKSGVGKNLEAGKTFFGIPAVEQNIRFRELAALKKLPDHLKQGK